MSIFPIFLWLMLPSHGQVSFLQSPRRGAGAGSSLGGQGASDTPLFLGDAQVQLTASCNPIPQHLDRVAFQTHCTMVVLKRRGGENRKESIPAFFKVS